MPSSRSYPTREAAEAGRREGELVAARYREYPDGRREVIEWGVVPARVEIDQGEGREPVRQPGGELIANWWNFAEDEVRRERDVRRDD